MWSQAGQGSGRKRSGRHQLHHAAIGFPLTGGDREAAVHERAHLKASTVLKRSSALRLWEGLCNVAIGQKSTTQTRGGSTSSDFMDKLEAEGIEINFQVEGAARQHPGGEAVAKIEINIIA